MDAVFPDLGRDVAAVAEYLDVVGKIPPLAEQKVFPSGLSVIHLVPNARVELSRVGFPRFMKLRMK